MAVPATAETSYVVCAAPRPPVLQARATREAHSQRAPPTGVPLSLSDDGYGLALRATEHLSELPQLGAWHPRERGAR
jgi:hypothetical protein